MRILIFKKARILTVVMTIVLAMCVTACSDDTDEPAPVPEPVEEPAADYTVIMYATCGGNLDDCLQYNLKQVEEYGYTPKVQFSAMVKYSKPVQTEGKEYEGTRLLTLTKDGFSNEKAADGSFRMDDPQNLADYITGTMKRLPAKKYILLLWDHGATFSLDDQPLNDSYPQNASRATMSDDSTGEKLSVFELEEALKRTGRKLDMVYWDMCLMNCIETIYQIGEYTHYVMGSVHPSFAIGANYAQFMESLDSHADLPTAMKEFIPATVGLWQNTSSDVAADLEMYDMSHLNELATAIKKYTDDLIAYKKSLVSGSQEELIFQYRNGSTNSTDAYYKSAGGLLYYVRGSNGYVDLQSAFTRIGNALFNGTLATDANNVRLAFDKFIAVGASIRLPHYMERVSISLNWLPAHLFTAREDGRQIPEFDKLYATLKFDQFTGWSRFLKENEWKLVDVNEDGEYVEIETTQWRTKLEVLNIDDYSADADLQEALKSLMKESDILFIKPAEVQYQFTVYMVEQFQRLVLLIKDIPAIPIQLKVTFISVNGEEEDVSETLIYPDIEGPAE